MLLKQIQTNQHDRLGGQLVHIEAKQHDRVEWQIACTDTSKQHGRGGIYKDTYKPAC